MIPRFWRRRERVRGGTILPERHFPPRAGPEGGAPGSNEACGACGRRSGRGDHRQPAAPCGILHLIIVRENNIGADVQSDCQVNGVRRTQPRRLPGGIQKMLPGDIDEFDPRQQGCDRLLIEFATAPGSAVELRVEQEGRAQGCVGCVIDAASAARHTPVEPPRQRLRLILLNEELECRGRVQVMDRHRSPRRSSSTSRDAMPVARLNRAKSMRALGVTAPRRLRRASRSPPTGESRATGSPLLVTSKVSPACTRRRIEALLLRSSRCVIVDTAITS